MKESVKKVSEKKTIYQTKKVLRIDYKEEIKKSKKPKK